MNKQGSNLAAWGGHVVDFWRLARFDFLNPHSYSKFRQLKALARKTNAKLLIETGTYLGNTAMRCSKSIDRVITIELDDALFERSKTYLSRRSNVECLHGDAMKLLPQVLARPDVNDAIVFLDGHFSGGDTALGDLAEPACHEVETLAQFRDKIRGFIVDDFRCFGTDKGWPSKSELLRSVEQHFGDSVNMMVHLDQLVVWKK